MTVQYDPRVESQLLNLVGARLAYYTPEFTSYSICVFLIESELARLPALPECCSEVGPWRWKRPPLHPRRKDQIKRRPELVVHVRLVVEQPEQVTQLINE